MTQPSPETNIDYSVFNAVYEAIEDPNIRIILVEGPPGSGKSTCLKSLVERYEDKFDKIVLTAPTGRAAINVNGQTMHRALGMRTAAEPFEELSLYHHVIGPAFKGEKFSQEVDGERKRNVLLVIDEIGCVRKDLLDYFAQEFSDDESIAATLIAFGDSHQLQPIAPDSQRQKWMSSTERMEQSILIEEVYGNAASDDSHHYSRSFFIQQAKKDRCVHCVRLDKLFRAKDVQLGEILLAMSKDNVSRSQAEAINERVAPPPDCAESGAMVIAPSNKLARTINDNLHSRVEGRECDFPAKIEGEIKHPPGLNGESYSLKAGSRVMCIANQYIKRGATEPDDGLYTLMDVFNGDCGMFVGKFGECALVQMDRNGKTALIRPHTWEVSKRPRRNANVLPEFKSKLVDRLTVIGGKQQREDKDDSDGSDKCKASPDILGSYRQVPLVLAYSCTVHKAQGLTLPAAHYHNLGFHPAQKRKEMLYVALSRVSRLKDFTMSAPITPNLDFKPDAEKTDYLNGFGRFAHQLILGDRTVNAPGRFCDMTPTQWMTSRKRSEEE